MRHPVLGLCLAAILVAQPAFADRHSCDQLRGNVAALLPAMSRDLPYERLDCAGISEVYLLLLRFDGTRFMLNQRIEAVFRRYGLIS
jgi:hypothetical protein